MGNKAMRWFIMIMIALFIFLPASIVSGCGNKTDATPETTSADEKPIIFPPETASGKAVFQQRCAVCHGKTGMGDGPAAAGLNPKPTNFTDKNKWLTFGNDEATLKVIREGGKIGLGRPSAMPAWKGALSEEEIRNVMKYEKSLAK